jgi:hypothetical protein
MASKSTRAMARKLVAQKADMERRNKRKSSTYMGFGQETQGGSPESGDALRRKHGKGRRGKKLA